MNILRHCMIVLLLLLLLAGVPFYRTGYLQRKSSGPDAVSSASMIIDQPSGAYVVLINKDLHPDAEKLDTWENFFRGKEIGYLFEDISCVVADSDSFGLELARSFQSRLPENQMKVRQEDITLMLSKARYGRYDVLLISKELYEAAGEAGQRRRPSDDLIEAEGI